MKGLDDERERERELLSQPRQDDPAIQAALADVRGPRNVVEMTKESDDVPKYLPPMYGDEGERQ